MITMEHLTALGKDFAADGCLSSPMVLIECSKGRGLVPVSDVAAESNQQATYEVGWQAGRNERQTGPVEQVAVIAAGWMSNPEPGLRPSTDPDRPEVLIISSWVKSGGAEHTIFHLDHHSDGRVALSTFDPQPYRIESPVLEEFISGYRDGQADLKREREKEQELEY